uniref:NADH-ubiquinone oxidoreductase chain 3 n=1 Tax=Chrysis angustula TaxID=913277 RepID=A0A1D9CJH5_9HYME|nr:NADH dehydrogenase subunit 3 [Chrysis angustula]AOY36421.1 NADH dehydrogenase subunit 3 [Chrysis angustula]AOY36427.1 NADH dehydrogenase subunit 3 [Chrysis angustula]
MYFVFVMLILLMIISLTLISLNFLISKKMIEDREKKSSYECGFDSFNSSRLPYSIHFFLISMIFLIFDIELSLLFPFIMIFELMKISMFMVYLIFILIFFIGLLIEWFEGSLEWKK